MHLNDRFKSKKLWLILAAPLTIAVLAAASVPALTGDKPVHAASAATAADASGDPAAALAVANAQRLSQAFRHAAKQVQPTVAMITNDVRMPVKSNGKGLLPDNWSEGSPLGKRFGDIPELRRFFEQMPNTPSPHRQGMGSGVIVDKSGIILTNNHVVQGGGEIMVRLHDGREFKAVEVKTDPQTDLAVVRIQGADDLQAARLGDSDATEIGDWVLALGHPFGLEGTVTAGIISAKGRGIGITAREDFLQTDAAINPGNSGGPLVNLNGEVVGINTAISSRTGGNQGVGFAVPINLAKWVTDQLISDGSVHRAHLGVVIQPVTHELARQFGVKVHEGVLVAEVRADSPAAKAGIQPGDVLVEFAGKQIRSPRELQLLVERAAAGAEQALVVIRDEKRMSLTVTCQEDAQAGRTAASGERSLQHPMGLELKDLTPEVAARLGVEGAAGVVITAVEAGSPAEQAGLSSGDVVVQVNRQAVKSVSDFRAALENRDDGAGALLLVRNERGSRFVLVPAQS